MSERQGGVMLVLGASDALIEGIAQILSSADVRVRVARTLDDAEELASRERPFLVLVDRQWASEAHGGRLSQIVISSGAALIVYHTHEDTQPLVTVSRSLSRLTLADLELPLERQRLLALTSYVQARARESGRMHREAPDRPSP
jgi:DNA-binding NtrC family response regulator